MKILNEYKDSHHYLEEWEKCDLYCPNCGEREVWQEQSEGDYYCGPQYLCLNCLRSMFLQGAEADPSKDFNILKKIVQIKTGITHTPTTKRGN